MVSDNEFVEDQLIEEQANQSDSNDAPEGKINKRII